MNDEPPFGQVHTVDAQSAHTHTVIVLHGRGSNGPEFAEEFLASHTSDNLPLTHKLPGLRWVFPSSQEHWSELFQEPLSSWFEAHSLTDITARQDLQTTGIKQSVEYLQGILDSEISKLNGDPGKLLLGGISQGGAIGLWTLLCQPRSIGAFFAASTWLPFASNIERIVRHPSPGSDSDPTDIGEVKFDTFVRSTIDFKRPTFLQTDIFLGHGADDAYVDVSLGRQVKDVLSRIGFIVHWNEYSGAEEEGHWFKVPEEMDDVYEFILGIVKRSNTQAHQQDSKRNMS